MKTIEEKASDFYDELNRCPTRSIVEYAFKKGYELAQTEVNDCVIPDVSKCHCGGAVCKEYAPCCSLQGWHEQFE